MELLLPNNDSIGDQPEDLQLISKELETALDREFQFNNWLRICVFYSLQFHLPLFVHLLSVLSRPSQVLPVFIQPEKAEKCDRKSSLSIKVTYNKFNQTRVDFRYNATYSVQLFPTENGKDNEVVYSRRVQDSVDPNNLVTVITFPDFYSKFASNGSSFLINGFQRALLSDLQQFFKFKLRLLAFRSYAPEDFPKFAMKAIEMKEFQNVSLIDHRWEDLILNRDHSS